MGYVEGEEFVGNKYILRVDSYDNEVIEVSFADGTVVNAIVFGPLWQDNDGASLKSQGGVDILARKILDFEEKGDDEWSDDDIWEYPPEDWNEDIHLEWDIAVATDSLLSGPISWTDWFHSQAARFLNSEEVQKYLSGIEVQYYPLARGPRFFQEYFSNFFRGINGNEIRRRARESFKKRRGD